MRLYFIPQDNALCRSIETLYKGYLTAVKCGNILSLNAGPDLRGGKLRTIALETPWKAGQVIRARRLFVRPWSRFAG